MEELPINYRRLEAALQPPERVYRDEWHERYHAWQANSKWDSAAKQLARSAGGKTVRCACGEEFSAEVV